MEKHVKIPTRDGHTIYGVLSTGGIKTNKLIIFVHGFTGHTNEHFLFNASRFFTAEGFDVFRFNLYGHEDDARKLIKTCVSEHVQDFETVFSYFKKEYSNIHAVGHSLGAQVVIRSNVSLSATVLWEPSVEVTKMCEHFDFDERTGYYVEHSNVDILIGDHFVQDAKTLTKIPSALKVFNSPLKVIGAELAGAKLAEHTYFANANNPKDLYIIKGSGHTFDEGTSEEELFRETLIWIEMY